MINYYYSSRFQNKKRTEALLIPYDTFILQDGQFILEFEHEVQITSHFWHHL